MSQGVYYRTSDLASPLRRLFILIIDLAAIYVGLIVVTLAALRCGPVATVEPRAAVLAAWLIFVWFYVVVLQAHSGTVGFLILSARIVDLSGRRPSLGRITGRALLSILAQLYLVFDWIWLTADARRQTLRDKVAGTYVICKHAKPAGVGLICSKALMFLMLNLTFDEVNVQQPRLRSPG